MRTRPHVPNRLAASLLATLLLGSVGSAAIAGAPPQRQQSALAAAQFKKDDINGDGAVSLQEFKAHHTDIMAFREADANHDGRLDRGEYAKAVAIRDRHRAGQYVSDAWITTKVKASLMKDDLLAGLAIGVGTRKGDVELSGWVDNRAQVRRALRIASGVRGVKMVHNALLIKD